MILGHDSAMPPSFLDRLGHSDSARSRVVVTVVLVLAVASVIAAFVYRNTSNVPTTSKVGEPTAVQGFEQKQYDYGRVSILGDSYMLGIGAPDSGGWAGVLKTRNCWVLNTQGSPSSGYVTRPDHENPDPFTSQTRLDGTAEGFPDLIIVQGSATDPDDPQILEQASSVYAGLKQRAEGVPLVVVGPTAMPAAEPAGLDDVRSQLRRAAELNQVPFIDPIESQWMAPTDYAANGRDLNYRGHVKFADRLNAELGALVDLSSFGSCEPLN